MDTRQQLTSIRTELQRPQHRESVMALVANLLLVTEAMMDSSRIGGARISEIAASVASIRYLLDELGRYSAPASDLQTTLDLARRFRDLEGRVKELRNDIMDAGRDEPSARSGN